MTSFVALNKSACDRIERWLPRSFTRSFLYFHEMLAASLLDSRPKQVLLDIGGGHLCPLVNHSRKRSESSIIAIDILPTQLRANSVVDYRIAADVRTGIPLADDSVDVIVSRSLLEHLDNSTDLFREMYRVLKPGGTMAHVFPGRYAPFAVLNRVIPNEWSKSALNFFFPEWKEECGFRAYYNNCYYPAMDKVIEKAGFQVRQRYFRYYQSTYFRFLVPLYLFSLTYDLTLWILGIKQLASQHIVMAQKPEIMPGMRVGAAAARIDYPLEPTLGETR